MAVALRSNEFNLEVNSLRDTFLIHEVGFEAQHSKHHQRGQNGREEVDERDEHGVEVAVVVDLVVAGEGDDPSESQTQGEEDLGGCFPPNLWLQHLLELQEAKRRSQFAPFYLGPAEKCEPRRGCRRHLGSEHVSDPVHRALQHQTPDQETEEHHVGKQRTEVHHLRETHVKALSHEKQAALVIVPFIYLPRGGDALDDGEAHDDPGHQQRQGHLYVEAAALCDGAGGVQGLTVPEIGGGRAFFALWLHD